MIFENAMIEEAVKPSSSIIYSHQAMALSRYDMAICLLSRGLQKKITLFCSVNWSLGAIAP
jgi:hypothetical protein